MIFDMISIIDEYWLLLLIGQYPNGPLGGLVNTLILSALAIVLAFPFSILLAFARLSRFRLVRWPATVLVYVTRGVPLLMLVLWCYFLVPQALYNMIPSMLSTFVATVKDTTLGYVINVPDLTFAANQVDNMLLTQPFQVFLILAMTYYVLCWSLTWLTNFVERRITRRRAGLGPRRNAAPLPLTPNATEQP